MLGPTILGSGRYDSLIREIKKNLINCQTLLKNRKNPFVSSLVITDKLRSMEIIILSDWVGPHLSYHVVSAWPYVLNGHFQVSPYCAVPAQTHKTRPARFTTSNQSSMLFDITVMTSFENKLIIEKVITQVIQHSIVPGRFFSLSASIFYSKGRPVRLSKIKGYWGNWSPFRECRHHVLQNACVNHANRLCWAKVTWAWPISMLQHLKFILVGAPTWAGALFQRLRFPKKAVINLGQAFIFFPVIFIRLRCGEPWPRDVKQVSLTWNRHIKTQNSFKPCPETGT